MSLPLNNSAGLRSAPQAMPAAAVGRWWVTWARALRVGQWSKNVLVFLPLVCSPHWGHGERWGDGVLMFAAFCLGASHLYLLNDVLDVASDRRHPTKRRRPLAAGLISVRQAVAVSGALGLAALALALMESPRSLALYVTYALSVMAYSLWIKRMLVLDVFLLAGFYAFRVFAGAAATDLAVSSWLLLFSVFFFLSLALLKRFSEVVASRPETEAGSRRAYRAGDALPLGVLGMGSGIASALVLALYWNSPAVRETYADPKWLWALVPALLLWICRLWLLAHRGEVGEDAISFSARDGVSWVTALVAAGCVLLARFS